MRGNMEMVTPVTAGSVTTGSKAGLFRTPISGGVQSALTVNNLPHPALAVHNLMQQVMLTRNKIIGVSQIVFFFVLIFSCYSSEYDLFKSILIRVLHLIPLYLCFYVDK